MIEVLQDEGLLPAIYFIFSRAGCDQAAEATAAAGLHLTDSVERAEIRRRVEEATAHLPPQDLGALGYATWLGRLEAGVAAHHAGMVPAFKETVEELFGAGLVKVVFATETLSLGINMPARTVVLERLSKFDGESHEIIQPGDYTQLTGRAGRRGIDTEGTAVVLHNFDVPFERVAAIAAEGSHPLVSSFQPTYNMAANLVAKYTRDEAEELLEASFAQFRATERRARLRESLEDRLREAAEFRDLAECDRGDIWQFVAKQGEGKLDRRQDLRDFAQRFRDGDVFRLRRDDPGKAVLLARGWGANPRMVLVKDDGSTERIAADELDAGVAIIGQMMLPEPVRTRDGGYRKSVARLLREWAPDPDFAIAEFTPSGSFGVESCPDIDEHLGYVKRARRAEADSRRLEARIEKGDQSVVRTFHSLLELLGSWGYVDGWELTGKGRRLRFVYNELDLLLTESIERGLFDQLNATELSAVASLFTFESRKTVSRLL